ncbi:MAG: 6-bladed beta-propeller [Bacteroidales bacterium]
MKKLIILFAVVITACNSNQSLNFKDLRVLHVADALDKIEKINLSEIASSIEYIPLETSALSVFGFPKKLNIIYENDILYIPIRDGSIKKFDSKGRYLGTFKRIGRGYGEYGSLFDFDLDLRSGNMCIEGGREINEYDKNENFVRKIIIPSDKDFITHQNYFFKKLGNLYISTTRIDKNSLFSAFVRDSNSNVVLKINYPREEVKHVKKLKRLNDFINPDIFKYKDCVRLINGNNKYVLSIKSDLSIDTAYIIDYGKYGISNRSPNDKRKIPPYIGRRFEAFESDNYLFMIFYTGSLTKRIAKGLNSYGVEFPYPYNHSFFNKKTGELKLIEQPEIDYYGFVDDFENGPPVWPVYVSSDNIMISIITAGELIRYVKEHKVSENLSAITRNLNVNDNYIIIKTYLKVL